MAQGRQTAGRIREENKIRRNPQRLEQQETGGYWLVTENAAQECETCEGPFLRVTLLHDFVMNIFTFNRVITVMV